MLNKVLLIGNLTHDPELRSTQSGKAYTFFRIAMNEVYGKGDDKKSEATFINCKAWNGKAEFICRHFHKGKAIQVVGRLKNSDYTDKEGVERREVYVLADEIEFVGSKGDSGRISQDTYSGSPDDYGDDSGYSVFGGQPDDYDGFPADDIDDAPPF